ncbi:glycine oxidase ThiO [Metaplanococcus flavidus]|uniref:glycine oxidase n=1 Tax=Metaplanococcus flavidus TaxID=569883 RepID=A0ABW3LGQ5_9BACL
MNKTYDAILVGGGVNGGAIAYNLAKEGLKVLLLEKDRFASKASGAAAGMLGAQVEFDGVGPLFQLAKKSRAMFSGIAEELKMLSGIDIELKNQGILKVALTETQQTNQVRDARIYEKNGEGAQLLTVEETRNREPSLTKEIMGGMYLERDGQVAASRLTWGFIKSASELGSVLKEHVEVSSFYFSEGKVTGVATSEGDFFSNKVVVTGGAWSEKLLKATGLSLEAYPVKGECFSVKSETPLLAGPVFSEGCYLVPKEGGRIVVGATVIPYTFNQQVTLEGLSSLVKKAESLVPSIVTAEWERAWAGIRPQTADGLPYLGEHPAYQGLYIATGHFRNGILLSPITGKVMAELIVGTRPSIDINPFHVNRKILNRNVKRWSK